MKKSLIVAIAATLSITSFQANSAILITEIAAWGSNKAPYASDWFELTNSGMSAVDISGWQMDDSSNGRRKVDLTGIASIAAGESVIFTRKPVSTGFLNAWFGGSPPAALQIGNYSGNGAGLNAGTGDAVNIFNSTGTLQANVTFLKSDSISPFQTFNNLAGMNNGEVSLLSVEGLGGAFKAVNSEEIGSPGTFVSAVPEVSTYGMMLAGLGVVSLIARRRKA